MSADVLKRFLADVVVENDWDGVFVVVWRRGEVHEASQIREIAYGLRRGLSEVEHAFLLRTVEAYRHLTLAADALQATEIEIFDEEPAAPTGKRILS